MRDLPEKICLIIPCYNEVIRLDLKEFERAGPYCYFLFVNDGSKDNTLVEIKRNLKENMHVLDIQKNVGKGEAIRQAMLYAKTLPFFQEIKWIGYWDADLSTPLEELEHFIAYSNTFSIKEVDAIWGSRILKLGSNIKRSFKRHILGRLFSTVIGVVLKVKSYDSQCGAKLFKKELLEKVFSDPFISKWIFDVEILLRIKRRNIIECPLRTWQDVKGSKIRVGLLGFRVLMDIIKIRKKYKNII